MPMKTLKIIFLFILFAFNCKAGDTTSVILKPTEFLFVELTDDFGNTIYRNYKEDGYIDLITTPEGHVNGKVHFYQPFKIQDFKVAFVPGGGDPEYKDWVLKVYDVRAELSEGEVTFGVMEKDKFNLLFDKFKEFSLVLVYKKDGVINGNEISIKEE